MSFDRPIVHGMTSLEILFAKMVKESIFPNKALSGSESCDLFLFPVEKLSSCNRSSLDKLSVPMGAHARIACAMANLRNRINQGNRKNSSLD